MRSAGVRLWAVVKIGYYCLCFVVGITVLVISFAVMLVSVWRLFLPRV